VHQAVLSTGSTLRCAQASLYVSAASLQRRHEDDQTHPSLMQSVRHVMQFSHHFYHTPPTTTTLHLSLTYSQPAQYNSVVSIGTQYQFIKQHEREFISQISMAGYQTRLLPIMLVTRCQDDTKHYCKILKHKNFRLCKLLAMYVNIILFNTSVTVLRQNGQDIHWPHQSSAN